MRDRADIEDRLLLQAGHERKFVEDLDAFLGFDFIELDDEEEPVTTNVVELAAFVERVNAGLR